MMCPVSFEETAHRRMMAESTSELLLLLAMRRRRWFATITGTRPSNSLIAKGYHIDTRLFLSDSCHKVLVVDDNPTVRFVFSRMLECMGHHVKSVESGAQALVTLPEYRADVIVSDISMPDMDGYELVRELRRRPETQKCYIVAMTGNGASSDEQASIAAGFDAHLTKPFDLESMHRIFSDPKIKQANTAFI